MIAPHRAQAARPVLDRLLADTRTATRPPDDPVLLVRRYARPADRELVGLLAALLAYGRVASILGSLGRILGSWGDRPALAVHRGAHRDPDWAPGFRHRWTGREDLVALLEAVRTLVRRHGSLGNALAGRIRTAGDFESGLASWVGDLREATSPVSAPTRGLRFLLADPSGSSACKRLRLYLRWMIRPDDGLDLGTWSGLLEPSDLVLPLDTHWARIGPRLGWTTPRAADGRMARELTASLRRIRPEDPLVYDFPVCHLGISGGCPNRLRASHCGACPLRPICPTGRRRVSRLEARLRGA